MNYTNFGVTSNIIGDSHGQIELLYNEKPGPIDGGVFRQIIDVLNQKKAEGEIIAVTDVVDAVMQAYGWVFSKNSLEYAILTYVVDDKIKNMLAYDEYNGETFTKIADEFAKKSSLNALEPFGLNEKKYFFIIAHSQGNFYAGDLVGRYYSIDYDGPHFSLLGIATPTRGLASEGQYMVAAEFTVSKTPN